jgi:hypothetical protein
MVFFCSILQLMPDVQRGFCERSRFLEGVSQLRSIKNPWCTLEVVLFGQVYAAAYAVCLERGCRPGAY